MVEGWLEKRKICMIKNISRIFVICFVCFSTLLEAKSHLPEEAKLAMQTLSSSTILTVLKLFGSFILAVLIVKLIEKVVTTNKNSFQFVFKICTFLIFILIFFLIK